MKTLISAAPLVKGLSCDRKTKNIDFGTLNLKVSIINSSGLLTHRKCRRRHSSLSDTDSDRYNTGHFCPHTHLSTYTLIQDSTWVLNKYSRILIIIFQ